MKRLTAEDLFSYDVIVCDLDGVVYRGGRVLHENVKVLIHLQCKGKRLLFLTNNSTRTPESYADRLNSLNLNVKSSDIITSGVATGMYLKREGVKRAYVVGSPALRDVLRRYGVAFSTKGDVVVVGMDRNFNYRKLKRAASLVYGGLPFIATNPDTSLPVEGGVLPGAGSMVAAIAAAAGKEPDVIVGKPNPTIFDLAISSFKGMRILVVGDRLNTDIKGGNDSGLDTLFVLTGVHTLSDVEKLGIESTYYIENLSSAVDRPSFIAYHGEGGDNCKSLFM